MGVIKFNHIINEVRYDMMEVKFNETMKKCSEKINEGHKADWLLFVNSVKSLLEALREFDQYTFKSPIIRTAFSKKFNENIEELEKLQASLKRRGMI